MTTFKNGDLLNAREDIIAHQVNCYGLAGGLAGDIFDKWPVAGEHYEELCRKYRGALLGQASLEGIGNGRYIANLFGQFFPGADYRPTAIREAFRRLGEYARKHNLSVAIPYKISCGICGGDWNEVRQIIEETMDGVHCVIYHRKGE